MVEQQVDYEDREDICSNLQVFFQYILDFYALKESSVGKKMSRKRLFGEKYFSNPRNLSI